MAPYQADQQLEDNNYEDEGLRVLGIGYSTDKDTAAFGVLIDAEGQVTDFLRLEYLCMRKNAFREVDRKGKVGNSYGSKEVI